jgi:hypothetical protein
MKIGAAPERGAAASAQGSGALSPVVLKHLQKGAGYPRRQTNQCASAFSPKL